MQRTRHSMILAGVAAAMLAVAAPQAMAQAQPPGGTQCQCDDHALQYFLQSLFVTLGAARFGDAGQFGLEAVANRISIRRWDQR